MCQRGLTDSRPPTLKNDFQIAVSPEDSGNCNIAGYAYLSPLMHHHSSLADLSVVLGAVNSTLLRHDSCVTNVVFLNRLPPPTRGLVILFACLSVHL